MKASIRTGRCSRVELIPVSTIPPRAYSIGWRSNLPPYRRFAYAMAEAACAVVRHITRMLAVVGLGVTWSVVVAQNSATNTSLSDNSVLLPPAIHATRLDYSEFDAPEAVTVITQDDIRLAGYLEISEIFRAVPGFRLVKIGDESRVSYHGTTATQNRRMLITIDGRNVLIGDGQYVEFDRLPIELEDIVRVTITRGPNGAAYGDNAFLASVDFATVGRDDPQGTSIRAATGHNERRKISASTKQQFGDYSIQFSAGMEHDGGYDFFAATRTPRDDGQDLKRGRLSVERDVESQSIWRLDANAYETENKTGIRSLRLTGEQRNRGAFVALSNQLDIGELSRLDWIVSYNNQRESIRSSGCYTPETIASAFLVVTDPAQRAGLLAPTAFMPRLLGVSVENTCFFTDIDVRSDRKELQVEYESRRGKWRYVLGGSGAQTGASSAQRFAGQDQQQHSYRIFAETDLSVDTVHASLGLMAQDSDNVSDIEFAWRGAINWQLSPNQALRYSYAHSFRVPSLIETETFWTGTFRFGRSGDSQASYRFPIQLPLRTNTQILKPETIEAHALGYFATFWHSSGSLDVKVFNETMDDPVESGAFYFSPPPFNARSFTMRGIEAEFTVRVNDRWRLSSQYSYLDSDASGPFERGLHGDHGGSFMASYSPAQSHALTVAYFGNSEISGNSYDRYDFVYNYNRNLGNKLFRSKLIFQHHIGGRDGLRRNVPFLSNEGQFAHLNQLFLTAEITF